MNTSTHAKDKMREAKPWVRRFGRFGYMTKGVVYGMIGILAALAAFGPGGDTTGTSGALLAELASQPFGQLILAMVAVGLILYGIYQIIRGRYQHMNFGYHGK